MEFTTELIPRILRDIDDGVLALDQRGRIIYMNPQSQELLNLAEDTLGRTYAEVFLGDNQETENDGNVGFFENSDTYQSPDTGH